MNIDRVARAMTGGRPRAGFTTRVMAPIEGGPQPGFTARVMSRLDAPAPMGQARAFGPAFTAALIIPGVIALLAGVTVFRASRIIVPALPGAPRLATGTFAAQPASPDGQAEQPHIGRDGARVAQAVRVAQTFRPANDVAIAPPEPAAPAIYMIAALEGPPDIPMKTIEPAACTIPALEAPAPLKVTDLPGSSGGSTQKDFKEQS